MKPTTTNFKKLSISELFRLAPIRVILVTASVLNWWVMGAIMLKVGGDSIGITPSTRGFVVQNHGRTTAVTAGIWLFCLFYPLVTLLFTPFCWFLVAGRTLREVIRNRPYQKVFLYTSVWFGPWSYALLRDASHSFLDYLNLEAGWSPFCWVLFVTMILGVVYLAMREVQPRRSEELMEIVPFRESTLRGD